MAGYGAEYQHEPVSLSHAMLSRTQRLKVIAAFLPGARTERPGDTVKAQAWGDSRLLSLLALGTVFGIVYLQITIALPLTLDQRKQSTSLIGVLLALSATTMVVLQPVIALPQMKRLDEVVKAPVIPA